MSLYKQGVAPAVLSHVPPVIISLFTLVPDAVCSTVGSSWMTNAIKWHRYVSFIHLKVRVATATRTFKWMKLKPLSHRYNFPRCCLRLLLHSELKCIFELGHACHDPQPVRQVTEKIWLRKRNDSTQKKSNTKWNEMVNYYRLCILPPIVAASDGRVFSCKKNPKYVINWNNTK